MVVVVPRKQKDDGFKCVAAPRKTLFFKKSTVSMKRVDLGKLSRVKMKIKKIKKEVEEKVLRKVGCFLVVF